MNTLLKKLSWLISILLIILIVRYLTTTVYLVPTPSMEPTIMSQDLIFAINTYSLSTKTPKRNEVWLFLRHLECNDKSLIMVKRLYGTPGDTIQFIKGNIMVNGTSNFKAKLLANTISEGSLPFPSQKIFPNNTSIVHWTALDFGPLWIPKKGVTIELNTLNISLYSRSILRESPHLHLSQNGFIANSKSRLTEYTFTKDYYFACGDNLVFSTDSRHWGFVSESDLISKAKRIIIPTDKPFRNLRRFFKSIE